MSNEAGEVILRRKRVTVACDSCRVRKSKCDGRRPVCARCAGYSYDCTWHGHGRGEHESSREATATATITTEENLFEGFRRYQSFVDAICSALPEAERAEVAESLSRIQGHVNSALARSKSPSNSTANADEGTTPSHDHSPGYLGEVSDIHFFNLAKQTFRVNSTQSDQADKLMDSYEQDVYPQSSGGYELLMDISTQDQTDMYLEAYFTTIHVAYPFIPKSSFLRKYHSLPSSRSAVHLDSSWLAQLYAVLAIGAYYSSFVGQSNQSPSTKLLHQRYFQRSVYLSELGKLQRSVGNVSTLLTQCFYLLAVSKTDGCWITLGTAIRLAQSVGLHTNIENEKDAETRRRVWYSLYVLDRLLSLQLGRPPAICDQYCYTYLPSRTDDLQHDWDSGDLATIPDDEPSVGDYFLHVIELSSIVGRVLGEIYSPRRDMAAKMASTKTCDEQLLAWRQRLPRFLRFDIGHAFEKSVPFRRQRNMLAVKFHHLRALMHRPYLCFPLFKGTAVDIAYTQVDQLQHYGAVCVSEAQKMARLLHNVFEEADLVHEFPWWQMISCFVCAGSILIVANACAKDGNVDGFDHETLDYDAEICLKVFEALSRHSEGAKIAKEMMHKLRSQGARSFNPAAAVTTTPRSNDVVPNRGLASSESPGPHAFPPFPITMANSNVPLSDLLSFDLDSYSQSDWPLEINDSMAWSAQFFDRGQGLEESTHLSNTDQRLQHPRESEIDNEVAE
ncbi:hypothetical protein G7046_g4051 [Stylonectria norvegica]|nr:hypothetical protein G7046_g4051 [Stylonectria norvegica]